MQPSIIKRPIIKRADVHMGEPSAPLPSTGVAAPRHVVKKAATIVEEAGRPVAIQFTCSCGETSILELDFPGDDAPRAEGKNS